MAKDCKGDWSPCQRAQGHCPTEKLNRVSKQAQERGRATSCVACGQMSTKAIVQMTVFGCCAVEEKWTQRHMSKTQMHSFLPVKAGKTHHQVIYCPAGATCDKDLP